MEGPVGRGRDIGQVGSWHLKFLKMKFLTLSSTQCPRDKGWVLRPGSAFAIWNHEGKDKKYLKNKKIKANSISTFVQKNKNCQKYSIFLQNQTNLIFSSHTNAGTVFLCTWVAKIIHKCYSNWKLLTNACAKGQLISKYLFCVLNSSKKLTETIRSEI